MTLIPNIPNDIFFQVLLTFINFLYFSFINLYNSQTFSKQVYQLKLFNDMLKEYLRAKSVVRKLHVLRQKQDCKLRLAEMGLQFNMSDVVKI